MMRSWLALTCLVLLAACNGVPFPDPEAPTWLETIISGALTDNPEPVPRESTEAATALPTDLTPEPTETATPQPKTPTPSPTPQQVWTYTGVIMGGDFDLRRPERNRFGVRSDVFLIYVFDHWPEHPERNQLSLVSLPRDLWLEVPCSPLDPELEGHDRVNAAWAYGQFDCVAEMIEANFNLKVNAPMAFTDFDGFMWLIGRLGAVRITPNQTYTDWCGNYHGTDGDSGRYVSWYEGHEYSMGPNEALCYVRGRSGHSTGDLDRNRRGLEMAQALGEQYAAYLFDTWDASNVASEIFAFMVDGHKYIDLDLEVAHAVDFAPIVGEAATAPRRTIRWTTDETDFWTTPIYGASVLLPTVATHEWLDCMIRRELPMDLIDGRLVCTDVWELEGSVTPTPGS